VSAVELLYRFEGRLGDSVPIGLVSEGLRLDNPFEGRITDGVLAGGRAWGTDHVRLRPDGVWVLEAREVIEVPGGYVHATARGYGLPPAGMPAPDLEAVLRPGFEPPEARFEIRVAGLCETGAPGLGHLNRVVTAVEGWFNPATRELVFEGRALRPVGAGTAVDRAAGVG
jgi:hypothetical protein